jgi:hypothetical protein
MPVIAEKPGCESPVGLLAVAVESRFCLNVDVKS